MDDLVKKFRYYKTLVFVLAFIILFEMILLAMAIPVKTTFVTITLCAVGFLCLYLIILCFRLIKELQEISKKQ